MLNRQEYALMMLENINSAYEEYAEMLKQEKEDMFCTSCDGFGDHGFDEEGKIYVCYGCGGTGKRDFDPIGNFYERKKSNT